MTSHAHWGTRAECIGMGDMFLPRGGEHPGDAGVARAICLRCPVRADCLEATMLEERGLPEKLRSGVRGGLTTRQRVDLERRQHGEPEGRSLPKTLLDAYLERTEQDDEGHVRWIAPTAMTTFQGRSYSPSQLSYAVAYRRDPEGMLRTACGRSGCVAAEHLEDGRMRSARKRPRRRAA